ncbi:MAG: hypothetical protein J6R37_01380, partial [Clostridia bacterium]|nr:hypothetical protein [Clostridia bacterium]
WMSLIYFVSLIHVSDNRELVNIKGENYKYIYKPIKLPIEDFVFWLDNAEIPETLYLRSKNGINYKFDISFNTKGKSSPFYNKEFLLDNKKIAHEDCLSVLQDLEIISKDHIKIYDTFDRNPPELCIKIIDDLKSKKYSNFYYNQR